MKKLLRKQLLMLAMVCATTAYAQTLEFGDKYYYDWFQKTTTGEIIYDEGSQDAWVTTVDQDEWEIGAGGHVQTVDGGFKFGEPDGAMWGTVTSPDFDSNTTLTLRLDLSQSNVGAKKSDFLVGFHISYKDNNNNEQNKILYIHINLKNGFKFNVYDQVVSVYVQGNQQYCVDSGGHKVDPIDHTGILSATSEGEIITIELLRRADYGSEGHITIDLSAHAGITIGASSNGSAKVDIYSDELVLRDDWDNTQRLIKNAGKKLKKVIVIRSYDKGWYTLSLPFDLTMKQFQRRYMASFNKAQADGGYTWNNWKSTSCAEIWHYDSFDEGSERMHFRKHDNDDYVLRAGVPYLIYVPEDISSTLYDFTRTSDEEVQSEDYRPGEEMMVFTNIVLQNPESSVSKVTKGSASFTSNLGATDIAGVIGSNYVYYLHTDTEGENPEFYAPGGTGENATKIKGFRAYVSSPKASGAKKSLRFSDDNVVTSIDKVDVQSEKNMPIINLQGQHMNGDLKGLPRGIYIMNGKKYVIK